MIVMKKVENLKELDELLPMIKEFHSTISYYQLYSFSGVIAYIVNGFFLPNFIIWYVKNDDTIIGYAIAEVSAKFGERECCILDAYTKENIEEIMPLFVQEVEDWARSKECKFISCYTIRDKSIAKKYGFESLQSYIIKKL